MFLKIIMLPLKIVLTTPVWFYKIFISPCLPQGCRFLPTCSTYFLQAVDEYGPIRGAILGGVRILRCRPGGDYGYDPVPINIKGESKWLF